MLTAQSYHVNDIQNVSNGSANFQIVFNADSLNVYTLA